MFGTNNEKANFAFETTLASRTFATWIPKLKKQGYQFHLVFLWLKTPELAVLRVAERVKSGGHFVPEDTIKRRYLSGLKNFFKLYKPLTNSWQLYDNSNSHSLSLIASSSHPDELLIKKHEIWTQLLETYNE